MTKKSLIITSIAKPNEVLKNYAIDSKKNNFDFILIGDKKSPKDFAIENCLFFNIEKQKELPFQLVKYLPENHYSRKNIGYLIAIKNKSEIIVETDDDNIPLAVFWDNRFSMQESVILENEGNVNIYKYFTNENIWPRGFPLESISNQMPDISGLELKKSNCPIQQGLANNSPDIDAIHRLIYSVPVIFSKQKGIALSVNSWCPFNSQNTTWFKEAFPLLYLPSYCSFRMTDIWRSFIAQRIAWTCNWNILFHSATVEQVRNEHNLLLDFEDEVVGYLNNGKIIKALENLDLDNGIQNVRTNLIKCYELFVNLNLIDKKEMNLVESWLNDINSIL